MNLLTRVLLPALALGLGRLAGAAELAAAMWVYDTGKIIASPPAAAELLAFCGPRRIEDLFWDIRFLSVGDRASLPDSPELRQFLRQAGEARIRVHALTGDPSDLEPAKEARVLSRVDALAAFNAAAPPNARFAGLHLDIEPHARAVWKTSSEEWRVAMLTRLVEIHAKGSALLHERAPGLIYGADVVFWLGKRNQDGSPVYPVTFNGATGDAESQLLGLVDQLAVMSYRSFAEGKNGLIDLVARTVKRADAGHARVFVGIKMAKIGPPLETFYGRPEEDLQRAVASVNAKFEGDRGYAGIAYFMYPAFRDFVRPATRP